MTRGFHLERGRPMRRKSRFGWASVALAFLIAALALLLTSCARPEAAVSAANLREAAAAVKHIGEAKADPVLIRIGSAMMVDATDILPAIVSASDPQPVATVTAAQWLADSEAAAAAAELQHQKSDAEAKRLADLKASATSLLDLAKGVPGVGGALTLALGGAAWLWKQKAQWQGIAQHAVLVGTQAFQVAEQFAPETVAKLKSNAADFQAAHGMTDTVEKLVAVAKIGLPVAPSLHPEDDVSPFVAAPKG